MKERICRKAKSLLSLEWKIELVREDANGDSENSEEDDDELPCVKGEN